jgi:hypothetical protein
MAESSTSFGRPVGWRLFVTVWLVYSVFATTNVVRETYLAISLGERLSARVDPYRGLHPDLFEIPGRGWFINGNPGASILGAVPYGILVHPAITLATRIRPEIAAPKPPATYDDLRPNRTYFMNEARARGLDIVLGLAALGTGVTLMAPAAALATLIMFVFLRARLGDERRALAMSLLFAFATPTLFRAAFLNHNAIVAHLVLAAFVVKAGVTPRRNGGSADFRVPVAVGLLLGYALVCDYTAIPFLFVFGGWFLHDGWKRGGAPGALRSATPYASAAVAAMLILFWYQWSAFGHPIWPAQLYMPPTDLSAQGWMGFTPPTLDRFARNLFDPRYGLIAFSPLLGLALAFPAVRRRASTIFDGTTEYFWIFAAFAALLLFVSAQTFTYLQWNTGVRYMVPIVPLLFLVAVPVLGTLPRPAFWLVSASSLVVSLAVTMMREDVPTSLRLLFTEGPTLPVLIVLRKMASGYALRLPAATFWLVAAAVGTALFIIWRPVRQRTTTP